MLYLYAGTPPNTQHSTFYFCVGNDPVNILRGQMNSQLTKTITPDKYTITTGTIRVAGSYPNITYIIDYPNKDAYFVDDYIVKSGYTEFSISRDLWVTKNNASFDNMLIHRTSKKINTDGVFAPIKNVTNTLTETELPLKVGTFGINDVMAVFRVVEVLKDVDGIITGTSVTRAYLACIRLHPSTFTLSTIMPAVSGIYQRVIAQNVDAICQIDKCWLIPQNLVSQGSVITFRTKDMTGNDTDITAYYCNIGLVSISDSTNINPNYNYYAGTRYNHLQLPRLTGIVDYSFECITGNDELQIMVRCGDKSLDLTSSFELGLTTNDGNQTATDKVAYNIKNMSQIAAGAAGLAAAPVTGGTSAVSGVSMLMNGVGGYLESNNGTYSTGTNAIAQYIPTIAGRECMSPFRLVTFQSKADEVTKAGMFGAEFDEIYTGQLYQLAALPNVVTGAYDMYLQCDSDVLGVPTSHAKYIQSVMAQGFRCVVLMS